MGGTPRFAVQKKRPGRERKIWFCTEWLLAMLYDTKATKNGAGTVKKSGPQLDPAHGKQYTKDV